MKWQCGSNFVSQIWQHIVWKDRLRNSASQAFQKPQWFGSLHSHAVTTIVSGHMGSSIVTEGTSHSSLLALMSWQGPWSSRMSYDKFLKTLMCSFLRGSWKQSVLSVNRRQTETNLSSQCIDLINLYTVWTLKALIHPVKAAWELISWVHSLLGQLCWQQRSSAILWFASVFNDL